MQRRSIHYLILCLCKWLSEVYQDVAITTKRDARGLLLSSRAQDLWLWIVCNLRGFLCVYMSIRMTRYGDTCCF